MKILFKQFFNSFKKNHFNIFSLSILSTALCFVISGAANLSSSFITSINVLNEEGNKANVVSEIPKDFGKLDFSYNVDASRSSDPVYVISSSLELNPVSPSEPNKFRRADNIIFAYNRSDIYDTKNPTKFWRKDDLFKFSNGWQYDPSNPEKFYRQDIPAEDHPIWDFNGGSIRMNSIGGDIRKQIFSFSFFDTDDKLLFNPTNLIFNKYGTPIFAFDKGNLSKNQKLLYQASGFNKDVIDRIPNYCDEYGIGITTDVYKRSNGKANPLDQYSNSYHFHAPSFNYIDDSYNFCWAQLAKYIDIVSTATDDVHLYNFEFDLSDDSSTSSIIKTYLKSNPNVITDVYNDIFSANFSKRNDIKYDAWVKSKIGNNKVTDTISLQTNPTTGNKYIQFAIRDKQFVDVTDSRPAADQINENKSIYLNNLRKYLSDVFSKKIYQQFIEDLQDYLKKQDISMVKEEEYFTHDARTDLDILFVKKGDSLNNSIVVSEGTNVTSDSNVKDTIERMKSVANGGVSRQAFYALKEEIDKVPDSVINTLGLEPKTDKEIKTALNGNRRILFYFYKYILNQICDKLEKLPTDEIPYDIIKSPEMKAYMFMTSGDEDDTYGIIKIIDFEPNRTQISFQPYKWIVALHDIYEPINIYNFSNSITLVNQAYAVENDKKYLPVKTNDNEIKLWAQAIDEITKDNDSKQAAKLFAKWLQPKIKDDTIALSPHAINVLFSENQPLFEVWKRVLPKQFKVSYQNIEFIIGGYALSPDFAFPIISPSSPIPNPKKQMLLYLSPIAFDTLGANEVDIFSYYSYLSNSHSDQEIIDIVNNYSISKFGSKILNISKLEDAEFLQTVWLRSYFPSNVLTLLVLFAILSASFILLLSIFTISFLMKSLIKNLLEPISICMANGTPFRKVLWAILLNILILTSFTSMLGFTIAYFVQKPFLSLFSSIWFIPTSITWFTPAIFVPLLFGTFGVMALILTFILRKAFKKPVPEIIANKESIKVNKLTNIMRNTKIKMKLLPKMSFGFSTVNLGRLGLLAILGALSVGTISSSISINSKFETSSNLTNQARDYNFEYQLQNVNESTGLYKAQPFEKLGFEDPEIGITSIYDNTKNDYPYQTDMLVAKQIPFKGGNANDAVPLEPTQHLSNIVLPSFAIYQELLANKTTILYNSVASIFLLKVKVQILGGVEIKIWDFVAPYFPSWIVDAMEMQADTFKDAIMTYYGEWYYDFLDLAYNENDQEIINKEVTDNDNNNLALNIDDIKLTDSGYYYAETVKGKNKYRTKPFYVWPDSKQWYATNAKSKAATLEPSVGDNLQLDASGMTFSKFKKINDYDPAKPDRDTIVPTASDEITWHFIPAYNNVRELSGEKISIMEEFGNPETIRCNDEFLKFITVVYADPKVSQYDSKLSFGIVPYNAYDKETNPTGDEKVTKVQATAPLKGESRPIDIYGIRPNSSCFPLYDKDDKEISHKIFTHTRSNEPVKAIISNGTALRYGLDVGDTMTLDITNNTLENSYELMNKFITLPKNPVENKLTIKVVGINSDSFGEKIYIDAKQANHIIGLDKMHYYSEIRPNSTATPSDPSSITRIDITDAYYDYDSKVFPFNTIVSKSRDLTISTKNIPLYTYANCWSTIQSVYGIGEFPHKNSLDSIVTFDQPILLETANQIKQRFDSTFDNTNDPELRNRVLNYFYTNFNNNKIKQALESSNNIMLLKPAPFLILPTEITKDIFGIISNLSTTLIVASVSLLIPLLILVCISTCLSIVMESMKQINLLKVLGYSNRNIVIMLLLSFIPVFLISTILGLGMVFGVSYGIQYIIFHLSSVFIYPYVDPLPYLISLIVLALIFTIALVSSWAKMNHSKLDTAIKF